MRGINEETTSRAEEAETNLDCFTRRDGTTGSQVKNTQYKQERNDRKTCERSESTSSGTAITGGMLDQLIGQFSDQLAEQERIIAQAQENIKKLNQRINECKYLRDELDKQIAQEN